MMLTCLGAVTRQKKVPEEVVIELPTNIAVDTVKLAEIPTGINLIYEE